MKRNHYTAQAEKRRFPVQPARSIQRSPAAWKRYYHLWFAQARRQGLNPSAPIPEGWPW